MKKKILFIVPNLNGGGSERMISNLCNNLDRNIFEIFLCLIKAEGEYLHLIKKDVKIIDLNTARVRYSIFKIIKTIKKENPDIVMSTLTHLNIYLSTFKFLLPRRVKLITRESNILSLIIKNQSLIIKYLCRFYYKIDTMVAQSIDMKDDMIERFLIPEEKIFIINNFVDINFIDLKLKEDLDVILPKNKVNLLSIGRLDYQKGFDILLSSFSQINNNKFHLTIIGNGPLKNELHQQIVELNLESNVSLLSFTHNPYKYMDFADVFISSSRFEGFPNVVIEALSCGLPVVANDYKGGIDEIMTNPEFGCIENIVDPELLESAIEIALCKDRSKIKELARKTYSQEIIIKKYECLFMKLYDETN